MEAVEVLVVDTGGSLRVAAAAEKTVMVEEEEGSSGGERESVTWK